MGILCAVDVPAQLPAEPPIVALFADPAGAQTSLAADLAVLEVARRLEVEDLDQRLEQRGVNPLTLAGHLAVEQRHQTRLREDHPGGEVSDRDADAHRPVPRQAGR